MGLLTYINRLKTSYLAYKERRFLKKHGCTTRRQYERIFDEDYVPYCSRVEDMYPGYNYIVPWAPWLTGAGADWGLGSNNNVAEILEWCYNNCEDKFRGDWHRVMEDMGGKYVQNGIGGFDIFFLAFRSERDVLMFNLRWL